MNNINIDRFKRSHSTFIKVGDYVAIKDTSYIMGIRNRELVDSEIGKTKDIFYVISINQRVPTPKPNPYLTESLNIENNCIIQNLSNGGIYFCSRINISLLDLTDLEINMIEREYTINSLIK